MDRPEPIDPKMHWNRTADAVQRNSGRVTDAEGSGVRNANPVAWILVRNRSQTGHALQPKIDPTFFKQRQVRHPRRSPDELREPSAKILHRDQTICRAQFCSGIRTSLLQMG